MWRFFSFLIKKIVGLSYQWQGANDSLNNELLKRDLVLHFRNYYAPFVSLDDLTKPLDNERCLPGLKLDLEKQKELLAYFQYTNELNALVDTTENELEYAYTKGMFGPGDAEILYGMIRHLKPKRFIEIGAGSSTLIAQKAMTMNQKEDGTYSCAHVCIEPYENPWLEKLGIEIIRKRVQDLPLTFFETLNKDDILFVDSSHVVKPQGDVLFEIFDIYGSIKSGVYIHVHDIFTPRDYPHHWVIDDRKLWHEQYILEAFLSFNSEFEIVCALNWLWRNHPEQLENACPVLTNRLPNNPGSFWFKRL